MIRETWVQSQVESYQRLKIIFDTSLFNTQHSKVRIKLKWSNPGKGIAPSPTLQCSSYWKGSLRVALDYGSVKFILIYNDIKNHNDFFVSFPLAWNTGSVQNGIQTCWSGLEYTDGTHCWEIRSPRKWVWYLTGRLQFWRFGQMEIWTNVECPIIADTPWFTLTRSGSTS